MTLFLSQIAGLAGAVFGGVAGFFLIIGLGLLTGADTQQGALAMGAATVGLPLGAVIGMILAVLLVVTARRRRPSTPSAAPEPETPAQPRADSSRWQGWTAISLALTCAALFWAWFHWTDDPPQFWGERRPILHAEIRIPSDDPDIAAAIARGTDLRNGNVYHGVDGRITSSADGDYTRLALRHTIAYRTDDRSLELWLGQNRLLVFNLDFPAKPPAQDTFSDWRPVDEIRPNFYGDPIVPPAGGHDIWIRTRISWRGGR